jgi:hypothetical protein
VMPASREPPPVVRSHRTLDGVAEHVVDAVEGDQCPPRGGGATGAGCVYVYSVVVGV